MPGIGDNLAVLSPLMAWWALLFGFSVVARYHPALWTRALDADRSTLAVPLESLLDEALEVVPALVLEPLFGNSLASPHAPRTLASQKLLDEAQERLDAWYEDRDAFHGPLDAPIRRKAR